MTDSFSGYSFLSPEQARKIRMEHVRQLEAEHYRSLLLLEETPADEGVARTESELRRRIDHHMRALNRNPEPPLEESLQPPQG